jgi:hypothetical protein
MQNVVENAWVLGVDSGPDDDGNQGGPILDPDISPISHLPTTQVQTTIDEPPQPLSRNAHPVIRFSADRDVAEFKVWRDAEERTRIYTRVASFFK